MNEQKGKEVASDVVSVRTLPRPIMLTPALGWKELMVLGQPGTSDCTEMRVRVTQALALGTRFF